MDSPTLVDTADAFERMLGRLEHEPAIAVDTESNSLYVYTERVCLIQFSVPGCDYLVDPLALDDLSGLGTLFADPEIEKVFHAAEYDVMVLHRDYAFEFHNLFDTMIASRIVGWRRYGLGALLKEHFGIESNKRMQRTNWGKRPLTPEQLRYAQLDTHFLLALRDKLMSELISRRRLEEARDAFLRVAQSRWGEKWFDPDGFWRIKGARDLDGTAQAVLRELYVYRDQRARALDRPPFKVLSDAALIALSQRQPETLNELERIKGLPRRLPFSERRHVLEVIARGKALPQPRRAARASNEHDEAEWSRYEALREWRKERASARGVEPDVILSNQALHVLARRNPTTQAALWSISALSKRERREYGPEIVALLNRLASKGQHLTE